MMNCDEEVDGMGGMVYEDSQAKEIQGTQIDKWKGESRMEWMFVENKWWVDFDGAGEVKWN